MLAAPEAIVRPKQTSLPLYAAIFLLGALSGYLSLQLMAFSEHIRQIETENIKIKKEAERVKAQYVDGTCLRILPSGGELQ